MKTKPALNQVPMIQQTKVLIALTCLLSRAKTFYQQSAATVTSGNLRRQFSALAELHQQILYLLPDPGSSPMTHTEELSELNFWYSNQPSQPALHAIQHQLAKQLQLQKTMIRSCDLGQHQKTLLHFTASLQIAADQLAEIKTC